VPGGLQPATWLRRASLPIAASTAQTLALDRARLNEMRLRVRRLAHERYNAESQAAVLAAAWGLDAGRMSDAKSFYESQYASFAGQPGYVSESRFVDVTSRGLERRRLLAPARHRTYADLGCGLGFKTYAFARRFERSVGFDEGEAAIELANKLNDLPTLEVRVADLLAQEPTERFDFVTAIGQSVLNSRNVHETANRIVALAAAYLADGGVFLVDTQSDCSGAEHGGWVSPLGPRAEAARHGSRIDRPLPHAALRIAPRPSHVRRVRRRAHAA
jgi:SAM-dependent methyltransferase